MYLVREKSTESPRRYEAMKNNPNKEEIVFRLKDGQELQIDLLGGFVVAVYHNGLSLPIKHD